MKNFYRLFVLLPALLLATLAPAQTCTDTPNSGADFKVFDAISKQEVTVLCVGRTVRLRDNSGRQLDPSVVRYFKGEAIDCTRSDTVTSYTPTAAGFVVITQNTPQPVGASGIIFSKRFEVKAAPVPKFDITSCSPGVAQITITDDVYDANLYSVKIGAATYVNVSRGQPITYDIPPGVTDITLTGNYASNTLCSNSNTQTFTPFARPPRPIIKRLTVRDKDIVFLFGNIQSGNQYEIQIEDSGVPGGFRTINRLITGNGDLEFTILNAPLQSCYRIRPSSPCQDVANVGLLASDLICTVELATPVSLTTTSSNGINRLNWSSLDGSASSYQIRKDERIIANVSGTDREYFDTEASCGTTYTYQVTAVLTSLTAPTNVFSDSNKSSVQTAAGAPPLPPRLVASFTLSNRVELYATNDGGVPLPNELTFVRTSPTVADVGVVNAPTITDTPENLSVANPPCYIARRRDACGSLSGDSNPACPVVLAVDPQPEGTRFTWSPLGGPDAAIPVTYRLIRTAPNGSDIDQIPVTGLSYVETQLPSDLATIRYRIEATGGGLATASFSNSISVTRQPRLAMPTAFSPNGDGLNDVLEVKGRFLDTFLFTVIDRNGQEVFRGTDRTKTWDGRINGRAPVPGAYAWRFESVLDNGKPFIQHGAITIVP